jgi:tetratricopeptide (TPR) repeat protein
VRDLQPEGLEVTAGRRASGVALTAVLLALLGGAVVLEIVRDRVYGEPAPARTVLYVKSPEAVKRMALGFSAVLADVYWIRALQYYGGTRLDQKRGKDYSLLYPLLDITTALDPRFQLAYRFGAIFLAENYPGGAGRPDLAVDLLQKGVQNEPDNWRYHQDIGFVYYWWRSDYREAAVWFEKASQVPGAPWWMKSLAAVTLAQGGDRRSSRLLWESLLAGADNDWLRENAKMRLAQLDALDQIDQLQAVVRLYASRTGGFPASLDALVRAGYLRWAPTDPGGTPYVVDPQTGAVSLGAGSPLAPLPTGQRTVMPAR